MKKILASLLFLLPMVSNTNTCIYFEGLLNYNNPKDVSLLENRIYIV